MQNQFTIILILQAAFTLISGGLVFYFQQKGKNLADKQDLQKLTGIVEEVKQKYANENELLKADLAVFTSKQNVIYNEGKDALIENFSDLNKWFWDSLQVDVKDFSANNIVDIEVRLAKMKEQYQAANISFGRVELLMLDETITMAARQALMENLKLHNFMEKTLKNLHSFLSQENSDEKNKILNSFSSEQNRLSAAAIYERNVFRDFARIYIYNPSL